MHKLDRLEITIGERTTLLRKELEIVTNAILNTLDIKSPEEGVNSLRWLS